MGFQQGLRALRAWVGVCLLATMLASCGGGGGGGVDAAADVRVFLISTPVINGEYLPDDYQPNIQLRGGAGGNLSSLSGKTIYVIVEDPASLFVHEPVVATPYSDGTLEIWLTGNQLKTSGTFTGNLNVHVCLDAACKSELSGSPLKVPYNVKVRRGFDQSSRVFTASTTFGEHASTRTLSVQLPENITGWNASNVTPYDPYLPSSVAVDSTAKNADGTGTLTLKLYPALPGVRQETIRVYAATELNNRVMTYTQDINVTYTIVDDPAVDLVFEPAELDISIPHNDTAVREAAHWTVAKPGVTLTWRGVEYVSGMFGYPQSTSWWNDYMGYAAACISYVNAPADCLPVGTYAARVHYTMTKNGVDTDVYYPIRMDVTP